MKNCQYNDKCFHITIRFCRYYISYFHFNTLCKYVCLSLGIQKCKKVLLCEEYFQIRSNLYSKLMHYFSFLHNKELEILSKINEIIRGSKIIMIVEILFVLHCYMLLLSFYIHKTFIKLLI